MHLHWHRRDIRLADNRGLRTGNGATVPVFVFDPVVLDHAAPPRLAFLLDSLESLRDEYRSRGGDLLVARGNPRVLLPKLASDLGAETVTWNRDYSGLARQRDDAVREALADRDIGFRTVHDAVHHEPGTITTNDGDPYKVFTYFSRKWHERGKDEPVDPPDEADLAPAEQIRSEHALAELPTLGDLGFEQPEATIQAGGTAPARELLAEFCEADIYRYGQERDYPARACTARLSPHLRYGTIGIRAVYAATEAAKQAADTDTERESVTEFQDQLAWREFYTQVLWDRPDVVTQNYKSYEHDIEWNEDETALQAWKDGMTGYPIVDAGMRQLREEAFMHNRVRMIVASFLTKDLLIDWRRGYEWFTEKLVDHDTANDNGGWQWAASTGTDAQPYFRIFNPMKQGNDYDPDAEYIREYVPELDGVPADVIHSWHELDEGARRMHAPDYPAPIVDHSQRREEAIAMFERARGD
jgi:deoxyribodipyrimidine photo-lyase